MSVTGRIGIDVGSTTAKVVLVSPENNLLFTRYRRHNARVMEVLQEIFKELQEEQGDLDVSVAITGSAGMGLAERLRIPFVQEVVAAADTVRELYPEVNTLVDIGGEDSKIIFFDQDKRADIRMNGNCAGGTGAFIDSMASLLNVPVEKLNGIAEQHTKIFPIASRCGVFAKTDLQNLLSRKESFPDIIASVFNAVAVQVLNTLARGTEVKSRVMFCGGPFAFIPMLGKVFRERLDLNSEMVVEPQNPELLPAIGTAINSENEPHILKLKDFISSLGESQGPSLLKEKREPALFGSEEEYTAWKDSRFTHVERTEITELPTENLFLGIDSGSTTSKLILCDENGRVVLDYYIDNRGNHVDAVRDGLGIFRDRLKDAGVHYRIAASAVTGYGEDLIKAVLDIDFGIVETIAHFRAASSFEEKVSFILDIGGQDMKAMFIRDGSIRDIQINEACSSGCGSFIQTFAKTLNYTLEEFAESACVAEKPCSLGSRCTVFMNSRVKQFLREGATVAEISAGLAYSVMRNCITKVLKISDMNLLGDHIVVQGGTFQNPAVHRAFELLSGKKILCPDISGHMGAFGAALYARDSWKQENFETAFPGLCAVLDNAEDPKVRAIRCKGCENFCSVNKLTFNNGNTFYSGNKCEKIFSNQGSQQRKGLNLADTKLRLLFDRPMVPEKEPKMKIGIPRVLNMFENFPFWNTLLVESGFEVVLSDPSTMTMFEKGSGTVMSDNICFPAKLVHGHIITLCEQKVDRIFYPMVVLEGLEANAHNSFNCPIVSGYPDVIRSAVNPAEKYGIPFDKPVINLKDLSFLEKSCWKYFKTLGVRKTKFKKALAKAIQAKREYKEKLRARSREIVQIAKEEGRHVIMLTGRPYHIDPQINHRIPEIITSLGMDVITGDSAPDPGSLDDIEVLTQWAYSNRLYIASKYVTEEPHVEMVQLNSFGCGPDAIAIDEMRHHLKQSNKNLTTVKIDDIASSGSVKLRLRTMVESLRIREKQTMQSEVRKTVPIFEAKDKKRTIIVPYFSRFHSPFVNTMFRAMGYNLEVLPPTDHMAQDLGLRYTNNEICYPAILVIGDLIKALQSGKYDLTNVAVGLTQTGGQCRASNYIALLKKALIGAGYDHIPIISVNSGKSDLHAQPGFQIPTKDLIQIWLYAIMMGDIITQMYYSTVIREKNPGDTEKVADYFLRMSQKVIPNKNSRQVLELVRRTVKGFNSIDVYNEERPKIGIIGEIYAKYSEFANRNVADWLVKQGVEVIIPPMLDFFTQEFVNKQINTKAKLLKGDMWVYLNFLLEQRVKKFLGDVNNIMKDFVFYRPFHDIRKLSRKAENILDLVNQYGEGWLLTSEFISFAEEGVDNILCIQPFGCIANQVVAKGVEKRMKDNHPNLNILYADLDADTSEANYTNRMHFLLKGARDSLKKKQELSTT